METNGNFSMVLMPALIIALTMSAFQGQAQAQRRGRPAAKTPPVAANAPSRDLEGEVGDVLFDGRWRFQVLSAQTVDSYTMKTDAEPYDYSNLSSFDLTKRIFTPKRGYSLVVIQCRVTNGQSSTERLWISISDNKVHTALVDVEGGSHPPIGYDFEGGPIQSQPLAPQAILNFPVLFGVPQGTKLKDLLFTLRNNSSFEKGSDVRVSLSAGQKSSGPRATVDFEMVYAPIPANPR